MHPSKLNKFSTFSEIILAKNRGHGQDKKAKQAREKARAEKEAALLEEQIAQGNVEPTLQDVMKELRELKAQVTANNEHSTVSKTS